jgi:5'-3' exonuclease
MGIPSYYKKLTSSVTGLVSKQCPFNDGIDWLWMDFNCLIYHCLHREDTPPYPGDMYKDEWEAEFIEHVMKYTHKVIQKVNPVRGTRICIDGVVPMAKMRQQRLRRFKSSWMTVNGVANGPLKEGDCDNKGSDKWDTNSITPGTHFMSKLRNRLEKMSSTGKKKIHISSSDEPGEGEHKIMADWRTREYSGNVVVYGLDADLIVLSILNKELLEVDYQIPLNVCLFREEIVSGKIERDSLGEEEFEWFSVNELRDYLCKDIVPDRRTEFIIHYCFAMSILGNDFLPSSLGLKIRDDGNCCEIIARSKDYFYHFQKFS